MKIGRTMGVGAFLAAGLLLSACAPVQQPRLKVAGYDVGQTLKDCPDCPEMVVLPTGSFRMGSGKYLSSIRVRSNETYRSKFNARESEQPARIVEIVSPVAVGKFELKFSEWDFCVSTGGCDGYMPDDNGWGRGEMPVFNVNWHDAKSYVAWLRRHTGRPYRLLSEAEWEFATRSGSQTRFPNGNSLEDICTIGNTGSSICIGAYGASTSPAGRFPANGFGLHDTVGNVNEWVEDCWHENYKGAPAIAIAWKEGGDCTRRVIRGGAWNNNNWHDSTSAARWGMNQNFRGFNTIGFRVALDL